ncbi:hypothetical protein A2Y85_06555 [candidate division WOR-3 bacterium RBG_13_43_14]|uniref:4Fe-4S ferredoxin-type domain-containing protein n=1 Tax=candidate division WOR-3 bacterium RBG_13_43_14 TaxID=1802590 RepID=A0A1F4U204_UNCW3|nr:MAG: hypothetical protein A2Y85_06555 [candidate division WOR-3 bacterium RBG_13_43_14]
MAENKKSIYIEIDPELRDILIEEGAGDAYKCYTCGKCASICPWYQVGTYEFPVFRFSFETLMGIIASSEDKDKLTAEIDRIYRCVGCEACVEQCPLSVHTPNILRAARRLLVEASSYPETLKSIVQKIHNVGNPQGEPRERRGEWAKAAGVAIFDRSMELLYNPCCLPAYDSRARSVAQATAGLLKKAGIRFGVIGDSESCCGEAIRRVGAEKTYKQVAQANISAYQKAGVQRIVFSSPHCFTAFRQEYPELGGNFETMHITQLLAELMASGKIAAQRPFVKRVVYHDPCTLGRQNNIYDEPRAVLQNIPGLELFEVEEFSRSLSVCCGAGSGGLWMDWHKGERIVDVRLDQLLATGAEIIAVACPYCLQMFEETLKARNSDVLVMDITEILGQSVL